MSYTIKVISIFFVIIAYSGCNSNSSKSKNNSRQVNDTVSSSSYPFPVTTNKGKKVVVILGKYQANLYAKNQKPSNPTSPQKAVKIIFDDIESTVVPIQIAYIGEEILVDVVDSSGDILASDVVIVTDDVENPLLKIRL